MINFLPPAAQSIGWRATPAVLMLLGPSSRSNVYRAGPLLTGIATATTTSQSPPPTPPALDESMTPSIHVPINQMIPSSITQPYHQPTPAPHQLHRLLPIRIGGGYWITAYRLSPRSKPLDVPIFDEEFGEVPVTDNRRGWSAFLVDSS